MVELVGPGNFQNVIIELVIEGKLRRRRRGGSYVYEINEGNHREGHDQ